MAKAALSHVQSFLPCITRTIPGSAFFINHILTVYDTEGKDE